MKALRFASSLLTPIMAVSTIACCGIDTAWSAEPLPDPVTTEAFAREIERVLPPEEPYAYHKRLSEVPIHTWRRNPDAQLGPDELVLPAEGWRLIGPRSDSPVLGGVPCATFRTT